MARVRSKIVTEVVDRLAGEWPLVGRSDVLARFAAARGSIETAAAAPATGIALVGPTGVGKTRLAAACRADAAAAGWRTARVSGSSAASSIPFGAVASLLAPDGDADSELAAIIRRSHAVLTGHGPLCLVVDDAHLLDDASMTLVQHIATTAGVVVVMTARSDRATSSLLTALWRDGAVARVDLDGLDRADHDALIAAALGGPMDEGSAERLFAATGGNPLFTREMLMAAADDDAIFSDGHRGWRLGRPPRSSSRLAELVAGRMGSLDDAERRCLETIAVAEPIGLDVIEALGFGAVVPRLERRRLVTATAAGPNVDLAIAQPMYGEVARDRLRPLRARNLRRALARAVEESPVRRHGDTLRIATWRLEAGLTDSTANLVAAASEALLADDVDNAERFAGAAHSADPSPATVHLMAQSHFRRRNGAATEAVLGAPMRGAISPHESATLAVLRAKNMFWLLGREADAIDLLGAALTAADVAEQPMLRAQVAELRVGRGADATDDDPIHLGVLTLLRRGRFEHALSRLRAAPHHVELSGLEPFVLVEGGWLAQGAALADRVLQQARGSFGPIDGWAQIALGTAQLADGNGAGALASFDRAATTFARNSDPLPRDLCAARTALAQLVLGEVQHARSALNQATLGAAAHMFGAELDRARAAVAVADGERGHAVEILRGRTLAASRSAHLLAEQMCLHDLVRLSEATAEERRRVVDLGEAIDSPAASLRARHANCADVAGLGLLAGDAEREGFAAWACEMSAAAAGSPSDGVPARAAAAEQRRATRLRAAFPRAVLFMPAAAHVGAQVQLRPGELHVARLAAEGLSDREISAHLHLSIRTVGNYLLRSYRRLGISGRDELGAALADLQRSST